MGDNFLRQQVTNFKKGKDLAFRSLEQTTLPLRPEILEKHYTAKPLANNAFEVGEMLHAFVADGEVIELVRTCRAVGVVAGESARVMLECLPEPGVPLAVCVKAVAQNSGVATVEIVGEG